MGTQFSGRTSAQHSKVLGSMTSKGGNKAEPQKLKTWKIVKLVMTCVCVSKQKASLTPTENVYVYVLVFPLIYLLPFYFTHDPFFFKMYVCIYGHTLQHERTSENSLWEQVLASCHVGSWDGHRQSDLAASISSLSHPTGLLLRSLKKIRIWSCLAEQLPRMLGEILSTGKK